MAKSKETFGKKENDRKKQKRRKDKEEKREERKANAKKGKSLDEMLAYVDENGNISSTPPDPKKKKVFNQEDMQIGVPKLEDRPQEEVVRTGVITFFNESKGYGFIKDIRTQESIFIHVNGLAEAVKESDKVTFEVEMTFKGLNAIRVKKFSEKLPG
jgi:cold shock CspA family protein